MIGVDVTRSVLTKDVIDFFGEAGRGVVTKLGAEGIKMSGVGLEVATLRQAAAGNVHVSLACTIKEGLFIAFGDEAIPDAAEGYHLFIG
jgi:hypothetical protein